MLEKHGCSRKDFVFRKMNVAPRAWPSPKVTRRKSAWGKELSATKIRQQDFGDGSEFGKEASSTGPTRRTLLV